MGESAVGVATAGVSKVPTLARSPVKALGFVVALLSAPKTGYLRADGRRVHHDFAYGVDIYEDADILSLWESVHFLPNPTLFLCVTTKKSSLLSTNSMVWSRDASEYQLDAMRATIAVLIFACVVKSIPHGGGGSDRIARALVSNGERYHGLAQQDQLPSIRLQHAAMAVANLQTARQLFSDSSIERSTGIDVHALTKRTDNFLNRCLNLSSKSKQNRKTLPTWS